MTNNASETMDSVEARDAEVLRLRDRELEIWKDRQQRVAELLELEARTGREVADGGSVADAGRLLAEGRAALDVLDRAADELARQREAAVPLIWRAQAESRRSTEAAKRSEAEERAVRTRQLLADLRVHEGCEYGPAGRQPGDGGPINPGAVIVYNRPRTAGLLAEADEEGRAAAILERQELNLKAGGQVSASSIERLIVDGLGDGRRVFPPLREVERWAVEADQRARARLRRTREDYAEALPDPEATAATWTLTWRGREILAGESHASLLGLSGSGVADNFYDSAEGLTQVAERSWTRPVGDGALLDSAAELAEVGGPLGDEEEVASG